MILGVSEWLSGKLGWKTSHIRIAFAREFVRKLPLAFIK